METKTLFGLVTAYDWDDSGKPLKLKICAQGEDDYFVIDNDCSQELYSCLRNWVVVTGRVIRFETQKAIDVEKINRKDFEGDLQNKQSKCCGEGTSKKTTRKSVVERDGVIGNGE